MTGRAGEGRVVVVTGANRGLGLEIARQCAARGDMVVLGSRDPAAGRRAAADLGDGVLPVALDVTDTDGLAAAATNVDHTLAGDLRRHGVLVNAVCPGWTATDMGGRAGRPVAEGAASILWAADLPDGGPTGTFTRDGRPLRW